MIKCCLLFYTGVRLFLFIAIKNLFLFESHKARILNKRKKMLKRRCCDQFICFKTPPQEQGRLGANSSMYEMYKVNNAISNNDAANPYLRVRGRNSKTEVAISIIGSNHESTIALVAKSGDFDNTIWNSSCSFSLLSPVYRNSKMNRDAISSTKNCSVRSFLIVQLLCTIKIM